MHDFKIYFESKNLKKNSAPNKTEKEKACFEYAIFLNRREKEEVKVYSNSERQQKNSSNYL